MDKLDIRIVRELSQGTNQRLVWGDVNPTYREIGRRLGVSKDRIRERIQKMRASGFLKEFPLQVNPSLLGVSMGALTVDSDRSASNRDLAAKLPLIDGMLLLVTHVSGTSGLIFFYADEASRRKKVELMSRICGSSNGKFTVIPYPRCTVTLSTRDWEIVAALQRNFRRSAGEIAAELGISTKTLNRRLKKLIEGYAISTLISTDARKLEGGVVANLIIEYSRDEDRRKTDESLIADLEPYLFFPGLWASYGVYSLILPSIPDASNVFDRTKRIRGVGSARMELVEDRIETYDILHEQVRQKVEALKMTDE